MVSMFLLLVVHVGFRMRDTWLAPSLTFNDLTYSLLFFCFTSLFLPYSDLIRLNFQSSIPWFRLFLFFFLFHFYFLYLAKFWPSSNSFRIPSGRTLPSPIFLQMLSAQIRISSSNPMTLRLHLPCLATPNLFITPALLLKIRSTVTWRRAC